MDNDELIKQARKLCGETYTGNGDGARIWLVNKIAEYPRMILALADALEAAQKENERLSGLVDQSCSVWETREKRLTARAEKAESYICQLKKQLSNAMKERDTYKAALQNWHEPTEGE